LRLSNLARLEIICEEVMKEKNISGSLVDTRSPVRTHVERRVKLNDTFIKSLNERINFIPLGMVKWLD